MTTTRDLFIVSMDMASKHPVEQGDLSLALAGAEVIDLLAAHAIRLDGDRIVPIDQPAIADHLLNEAASSLVGQAPYELVGDWLWRRGRNLSAAYLADLEAEGQITRQRDRHWGLFRTNRVALVDSLARRLAVDHWASGEPVLAALGAAVGIRDERTEDSPDSPNVTDEAVATVLAAIDHAAEELAAERRQRVRRVEEAAETNRRRGY